MRITCWMPRSWSVMIASGLLIMLLPVRWGEPGWAQITGEPERVIPLPSAEERAQLPPDGGPKYNRLVFEASPYLLQHATNPIAWYAWGEAAFAKARQEDKPIFLSIGYSTCHWCHVMERESFADAEVAQVLNQYFVAIKVDREERPDIDHLYMEACQRVSQQCGWPLNVLMTPEQQPFFIGTYFPRVERFGRPGMLELLPAVNSVWRTRRQDILNMAQRIVGTLQTQPSGASAITLDTTTLALTYEQLSRLYDAEHGGIGGAPKFPKPLALIFLLRYWKRTGEAQALNMVETTLQAMRRGGIYDHLGFGFHRYATDARWLVPHFEKMLYDQALLLMLYTETYQATGKALYAHTAREIATYVLRDMTAPEGGFYSAEDADSEGVEGKFYLWTAQEIQALLGDQEALLFVQTFNIAAEGNFSAGAAHGHNIPYRAADLATLATQFQMSEPTLQSRLEASRQRLFAARQQRPRPFKDDKVLTDWNGLMIAALAKAGQVLEEADYIQAARRAADFLLHTLRDGQGRLLKRYRAGQAGLTAHVNDYAYVIWGLLDLYEATFAVQYLQAAVTLQTDMLHYFWDTQHGGFFFTASDAEALLIRSKETLDMSQPAGNSVAALNLVRLERMTANTLLAEKAAALFRAVASQVVQYPALHAWFMSAVDFVVGPSFEVVITGTLHSPDTQAMLRLLRQAFLPNKVVVFRPSDIPDAPIGQLAPYTLAQRPLDGKATAYVCQNYVCNRPTTDPQAMLTALESDVAAASRR